MTVLSKVRFLAFLVVLVAAMTSSDPLVAGEFCDTYGPCESCDTPVGRCYLWEGGQCEQYNECTTIGWCSHSGGTVTICNCGPCDIEA
jgi:hypothetical protein